jgi:hypothetical protein
VLAELHAEQYLNEVLTAYLDGLRNSYFITVACAAAAFVAACGLSWKKIQKQKAVVPGEGEVETGEFRRDVDGEVNGDANGVVQEKA